MRAMLMAAMLTVVACGGPEPMDFGGTWEWKTSAARGLLVLVPSHDGRVQGFFSSSEGDLAGMLYGYHDEQKIDVVLGKYGYMHVRAKVDDQGALQGLAGALPFTARRH